MRWNGRVAISSICLVSGASPSLGRTSERYSGPGRSLIVVTAGGLMRAGNHVGIEHGSAGNWWSLAGMTMRDQRV
jgi:hypothetical protein